MTIAITRHEPGAGDLRREAARCRDARAARRMLALALVLEGASREEAARAAGMDRQTLRDWVHRYNAEGLAGLHDRHRSGRKPRLTPEQEAELATAVEQGPDPDRDPRVGLRPPEGRLRGALAPGRPPSADRGPLRGPAARAHGRQGPAPARLHPPVGAAQAPEGGCGDAGGVQKSFAELVAAALPEHARGKPVEVWFQDEARVGQQGTLTRVWARRGTRPRAPRDRRHAWAYLFGAVCPERAVGAALVLPYADAAATGLHLAEIGRHVAPGAHAVVVLDGAGWHGGGDLAVPENLSLLPLPRYSPELNPVENVWEYLRQNKLGHRVWPDYEAIVATCCEAWNWLVAAPDRLASITRREWAKPVTN
jgi:transposase-like protein